MLLKYLFFKQNGFDDDGIGRIRVMWRQRVYVFKRYEQVHQRWQIGIYAYIYIHYMNFNSSENEI